MRQVLIFEILDPRKDHLGHLSVSLFEKVVVLLIYNEL